MYIHIFCRRIMAAVIIPIEFLLLAKFPCFVVCLSMQLCVCLYLFYNLPSGCRVSK
jgi:hypothetical protein